MATALARADGTRPRPRKLADQRARIAILVDARQVDVHHAVRTATQPDFSVDVAIVEYASPEPNK